MKVKLNPFALVMVLAAAAPAADEPSAVPKPPDTPEAKTIDFATQIKPIFAARCYECHGPEMHKGKLRLDQGSSVFEKEGLIKPGAPNESLLFKLISLPPDDDDIMPAEGDPLTKDQIQLIHDWIQQGAKWPEEVEPTPPDVDHFKLAPLDEAQKAAEAAALAALGERGVVAKRVAANTTAVEVNFSTLAGEVTDKDLEALKGLEPTLVWLNLAGTQVTDAGLAGLMGFKQLRRLHLERTGISDAGLTHVVHLSELEYLNLYETQVSVAGLGDLVGLEKLRSLYIGETPAAKVVPGRSLAAPTIPKWLTLTANADGTAVLSGTPGSDDVGEHTVVLEVSDGYATGQQSFKIVVKRANRAPAITSKPVVDAAEGATYSYTIQTADPDDPLVQLQAKLKNVSVNIGR